MESNVDFALTFKIKPKTLKTVHLLWAMLRPSQVA